MMDSTLVKRWLAVCAAACALPAAAVNHDRVVAPLAPGRFAVACSNLAQDTSRVAPGAKPSDYWEGRPINASPNHYITELLVYPQAAITFSASCGGWAARWARSLVSAS